MLLSRAIEDGEHSEHGNSKKKSEEYILMSASSETWQLGSQAVQVSHLEKRYWPTAGLPKGDILDFYPPSPPRAPPPFKVRPATLRLVPSGGEGGSFSLSHS